MADLPADRITADLPPFTDVGMDYFGPVEVKWGRSTVKRYGVIFACLTSCGVHLEVAHILDTDSCINAIRRFVCRRGQVQKIRSDNGTNYVSANRELKLAVKEFNQDKIHRSLMQDGIQWSLNPPHGAHHGGVWERLVQQVKKVLCTVVKQQILDDKALNTVLCEVEAMLNDRPITPSTDDPNDLESFIPNHLLQVKTNPLLPPGLFKISLHPQALEAGPVYCKLFLEEVGERVSPLNANTPEVGQNQKKLCSWGPCACHG